MPVEDGMDLIITAFEKKQEEKAWQMWLMQYQHMTKETYKPFEEFYQPIKNNKIEQNHQSVEEILNDVKAILNNTEYRK